MYSKQLSSVVVCCCWTCYRLASETFHFACLLTAATVLPCMCVISPSLVTWMHVWTWEGSVHHVVFYMLAPNARLFAVLSLKGAVYIVRYCSNVKNVS